jgi:hypothetical protein
VLSLRNLRIRPISFAAMLLASVSHAQVQTLMVPQDEDTLSKADVTFQTDLNHLTITVSPGSGQGGGCKASENWDTVLGRCTSAVVIDTKTTSRSCSCSCPSGYSGSCRSSQSGTYSVFGWRIPPSGTKLVSHNGATSWGTCRQVSNTCKAPSTPPPTGGGGGGGSTPPSSGTNFVVSAWICGSGNSGYSSPAGIPNQFRNQLISGYRAFSYYDRCPEAGGYSYWLGQWKAAADKLIAQGVTQHMAYSRSWHAGDEGNIKAKMDAGAAANGEHLSSHITQLNKTCQAEADKKYGKGRVKAVFDTAKKGATCKVS